MPLKSFFIGPDDADTCSGCRAALNGNPYTAESAPEPGTLECGDRCRHMVQVQGELDAGETEPPSSTWRARLGLP
jgi:hypothetical protein